MVKFSNHEDLRNWLEGKPREWAVVIAARAALRVAPMLATAFGPRGGWVEEEGRAIVLLTFRSIAVPWVLGTWPPYGVWIDAAITAADVADLAADTADNAGVDADAAYATRAAAYAARAVTHRANAVYAAQAGADANADSAADIWAAVSADASELEGGVDFKTLPNGLAAQALWPAAQTPKWATDKWLKLKRALLDAGEEWDVWTDWYEARLRGSSANEALELARVQIAEEIWQQGPKVVNAHIKELIAQYEPPTSPQPLPRDPQREIDPPSIPAPRRAAVEPLWSDDGQLTVPTQPIAVNLQQNEFPNALRALRNGLQKFADDLDGETNIDRRFVAYLRHLAAQIPDAIPPQHQLFELGHAEEIFIKYAASVNEQWPEFLAARFHAMVRQHDNTMRQAPAWRDFKRNAFRDIITPQQVAEVAPIAAEISSALRDDEARSFVDAPLPDALDALAEPLRRPPPDDAREEWRHAIEAGNELLALDVIESINNTLKRIAEVAVATGATLGKAAGTFGGKFQDGLLEGAAEEGHKYGKRMVKWLCLSGTAGASIGLQQLIATYPHAFGWLGSVIEFLSRLHLP